MIITILQNTSIAFAVSSSHEDKNVYVYVVRKSDTYSYWAQDLTFPDFSCFDQNLYVILI